MASRADIDAPRGHRSSESAEPRTVRRALAAGATERSFLVHLPEGLDPDRGLPLVVALHGGTGTGATMERLSGFSPLSDAEGFAVCYPEGIDNTWNDGVVRENVDLTFSRADDVGFLSTLIETLSAELGVPERGVLVCGISNGGHMAVRLGCERADLVGAVGPVAATMTHTAARDAAPSHGLSLLYFHGTDDPIRYWHGGGLPGGDTMGGRAFIDWWVQRNGCVPAGTAQIDDAARDGTSVSVERYSSGRDGAVVVAHVITGGGHTWPGGPQYLPADRIGVASANLSASERMWAEVAPAST